MTGNIKRTFRQRFRRSASAGSILFGALCGVVYALMIYEGNTLDSRIALAVMFISAGVMGVSYFVRVAKGRRTLPWIAEQLKLFFALWTLIGFSWVIRIFGHDRPPEDTWAAVSVYFLTGSIAGTVWVFALSLFLGIKQDIGAWEVVRFPVWIKEEVQWLVGKIWRKG